MLAVGAESVGGADDVRALGAAVGTDAEGEEKLVEVSVEVAAMGAAEGGDAEGEEKQVEASVEAAEGVKAMGAAVCTDAEGEEEQVEVVAEDVRGLDAVCTDAEGAKQVVGEVSEEGAVIGGRAPAGHHLAEAGGGRAPAGHHRRIMSEVRGPRHGFFAELVCRKRRTRNTSLVLELEP